MLRLVHSAPCSSVLQLTIVRYARVRPNLNRLLSSHRQRYKKRPQSQETQTRTTARDKDSLWFVPTDQSNGHRTRRGDAC